MHERLPSKQAIVLHSGGMDSSLCLALAIEAHGATQVQSLTFFYGQRHQRELTCAKRIAAAWGVDHQVVDLTSLAQVTHNALIDSSVAIVHPLQELPNTWVVGRNGLMARLGAIYAKDVGAKLLYMGVLEAEGDWGYPDCSRRYIDLKQEILRIDLQDPAFEIRTPLIKMTKRETLEVGHRLGILPFLLNETLTCYEGFSHAGCGRCPACCLRNEGLKQFLNCHPDFVSPYVL